MKIAIIGTGGVGGYFGGKLANAGFDVTFLARGEHFRMMKNEGLKVKSINGDFIINPVKITDQIQEIQKADLIIIGVKAWQVREIAVQLPELLRSDSVVLPLQNGVLAIEELMEQVPGNNIIGGLCRILSKIEKPGIINHFGVEPTVLFGELNNARTKRVQQIKEAFDKAGVKAIIAKDIHAEIWKKFIAICVSGLLAVTNSTYGQLRECKETRQLMIELLQEIYKLSRKEGIRIEQDFILKTVAFIDTFPYDSTSSLTRDVWEGKPSEIEYQNGTVIKLAVKYHLEVPVNRFVYSCILPQEIRARSR